MAIYLEAAVLTHSTRLRPDGANGDRIALRCSRFHYRHLRHPGYLPFMNFFMGRLHFS